jgi:hypothetical protein
VIGDPPLSGANHEIFTPVFKISKVVGASGVAGILAALTSFESESELRPTRFLD